MNDIEKIITEMGGITDANFESHQNAILRLKEIVHLLFQQIMSLDVKLSELEERLKQFVVRPLTK